MKKLEKPAEAEVENVKMEVAEKEFSQIPQSSQSAENNFSQISQIPQSAEKNFSQSSLSTEKNFSQSSQISENPEESQDSFDTFASYSESQLTPHQRPD